MTWRSLVNRDKLVEWRRYLHQHAELSFQEKETSQYICDILATFPNIEVLRPTETGVVGVLRGAKPGKVVGLRADIDALPIVEEANVEFKSLNHGVMHACGHDANTAMLLGAASVLSRIPHMINGTVKFIFQHAEELFPGGARALVDSGVLDDVDCFFGEHIVANTPVGQISCWPGPATASPDSFTILIKGRGSHGASPEVSIDPITIGAELVSNLNNIVSRNVSPLDNAVVTVAKFVAGSSFNIIPPTAELAGTVRTYNPEIRTMIESRMRDIVEHVCKAYGADYTFEYIRGYDSIINDEVCVGIVHDVAKQLYGNDVLCRVRVLMAGDDFSVYQTIAPVAFMLLGCGVEEEGCGFQAHHPKFRLNEDMLPIGCEMFIGCTLEALRHSECFAK